MYEITNRGTEMIDDEGQRTLLCNFAAQITEEVKYHDGQSTQTYLTLEGQLPGETPLTEGGEPTPAITVDAATFTAMTWPLHHWGVRCCLTPGGGNKDHLRAAIQMLSKPKTINVYRHTGWSALAGKRMYLHAKGAITEKGNDPSIRVELPNDLRRYDLQTPKDQKEATEAWRATFKLIGLTPPEIGWPLFAATFAPLLGSCDYAVHISGRTGTYKSELTSLWQAHYGPTFDARHLPGSWTSTGNALEAQAFHAKNALFTIDDFVPVGSTWQQKAYQTTADKIIRGAGNQAGRARLTDTSKMQNTMHPRGMILSTGEDVPEGHSVRARMMILELTPGDIDPKALTDAQRSRQLYNKTTVQIVQNIAKNGFPGMKGITEELRDKYIQIGHSRTPTMIGHLIATALEIIDMATQKKAITPAEAKKHAQDATNAIVAAGERQRQYLETADPTTIFSGALKQTLGAGTGHIRTLNGGVPLNPEILGWTQETASGSMPTFRSRGPCIGWISWDDDELYLDQVAAWSSLKKAAGNDLSLSKQTLMKRLKDAGLLARCDETRQRNTIRLTAENHPRTVICLSASQILELSEKP